MESREQQQDWSKSKNQVVSSSSKFAEREKEKQQVARKNSATNSASKSAQLPIQQTIGGLAKGSSERGLEKEPNNNDISALPAGTDPRIQSIANVLNQHKLKQQQQQQQVVVGGKKGLFEKKLQLSSSSSPAARGPKQTATNSNNHPTPGDTSSSQIDQGNSYLYAYNEFVTSPFGATSNVNQEQANNKQLLAAVPLPPHSTSSPAPPPEVLHPFLKSQHEESLIESDEDDALSYILHQHQQDPLNQCAHHNQLYHYNYNHNHNNRLAVGGGGGLEGQALGDESAIEHHLSCSRSSHPRHICGIGANGKSNIAVRLREESQRAFVLNQRHRALDSNQLIESYSNNKLSYINRAFLSSELETHKQRERPTQLAPAGSCVAEFLQEQQTRNSPQEADSSSGSSNNINYNQQHQPQHRLLLNQPPATRQTGNVGYLSWLVCCLCNLVGYNKTTTTTGHNLRATNLRANGAKESARLATMYTSSQHQQQLAGLSGQMGAYYASNQPEAQQYSNSVNNLLSSANHHHHQLHQQQHLHQQHFPGSSDSSLGSSGAFGSSCASRLSALFRQCCSKKCLFVSCIMLILMIFILVIGLSAYLNFLINLNKVNLSPLSGRLKVESQGDQFNEMLLNKTSKEFLAKQLQYETILRGALDRTQSLLKSYPLHLVKLEVYSFKPGSLWIYFRLFINKKTLMLDNQLMKRKSPDEQLERQFLPRLTQQTLHSGFEQLMSPSGESAGLVVGTSGSGDSPQRHRSSRQSSQRGSTGQQQQAQQSVKSFDDQINRLMPIIESIDLQSIQVTPEFDMLQAGGSGGGLAAFSDNLRASSQFLTPTTTTPASTQVLMATGRGEDSDSRPAATTEPSLASGTTDEISVSTRKFTLYGYKENATRPATSIRPSLDQESLFLVNQQQKKPTTTSTTTSTSTTSTQRPSQTTRELQNQRPPPTGSSNVVKLVSGQPERGQAGAGRQENRTTLFGALPAKSDGGQMVAPYQKVDFSSPSPVTSSPKSIQELWSSALSKKNVTMKNELPVVVLNQPETPSRRPANATFANSNRVSVFSSDVSNTIRAQLVLANQSANQSATQTTTTPASSSSQKPKVSPHLKHGGAIISTPSRQLPEEPSPRPQSVTTSAIVLNRDFQPTFNNQPPITTSSTTTTTSTSTTTSAPPARLNQNQTRPFDRDNKQTIAPRKPSARLTSSQTAPTANGDKQLLQQRKPAIKKIKKTQSQELQPSAGNSTTSTTQNLVNSKGIRIVDNFLASIESKRAEQAAQSTPDSISRTQNSKNKTLERFNFNSDSVAPTLPTTIELIRSTTASIPQQQPSTTTERPAQVGSRPASGLDSLDANAVVNLSGQLNRPGTSSFSNQWRPITNLIGLGADQNNRTTTTTRKPSNLSLILAAERLPVALSAPGSQSPFAMSTAIFETKPIVPIPRIRTNNKPAGNTYQVVSSRSGGGNEFESRRVSRMRQATGSGLTETTAESSSSGFATTSTTTTTTTSSSLSAVSTEPNTRLVDDFVITTDKIEGNTRGSTLLPPLVVSSMHELDPLAQLRAANPLLSMPQRTRGPFAFDTLKSSPVVSLLQLPTSGSELVPKLAIETASSRLERSPSDSKLLVRKKLFLDGTAADSVVPETGQGSQPETTIVDKAPSSNLQIEEERQFGNRRPSSQRVTSSRQARLIASSNEDQANFRCQFYGCKAKGSLNFICLNHTQLCDDFIDCQDESDELDCVSLLQHDSNSNKLSFSNGAGIIYLNRKGSLAPLCIDYFLQPPLSGSSATNSAHDLEAISLAMGRKQQELIRQINTIGQYACSLQSFSRLVSVKINHHSLIDGLDLIKSSRLYHRLSIVSPSERQNGDDDDQAGRGSDPSYGSYRSGSSEYEVEISTSPDCPSQRTVFVKCGSFECGQDSFSIIDAGSGQQQQQTQNNSSGGRKPTGVVINDFPWLVKLYWFGTLSCHGYLIDDLWLITSSECFANKTTTTTNDSEFSSTGWTAEISYEHYGNDDYQSIESNRRSVKEILARKPTSGGSPIVLAKLEKPVRFSPLNRPICLPQPSLMGTGNNKTGDLLDLSRSFRDCVTATLSLGKTPANSQQSATDLVLNKVRVERSPADCIRQQENAFPPNFSQEGLICVSEQAKATEEDRFNYDKDQTHVLICSNVQGSRSRSRWTVVGVQNRDFSSSLDSNKQLFTSVSSHIDWIIDTMDPKPAFKTIVSSPGAQPETCNRFKCSSGECLSYSRICDGLYDCSSQDDEKDCHK